MEGDGNAGKTFLISGENGLDHAVLRRKFGSVGFEEREIGTPKVGVVWAEVMPPHYNYDRRLWRTKSVVKNILEDSGKKCVTDKRLLHEKLMSLFPELYFINWKCSEKIGVVEGKECGMI